MKREKFKYNNVSKPFIWIVLLMIGIIYKSGAQKPIEYDKIQSFNIVVNYPDCTVKTQMLKEGKNIIANENCVYHWYASNKIMNTKGGYDGKLLHGYYKCFYLNNNLKELGSFKYGIKTGEWRNWAEDGKLKEIVNWKKGKKNGKYKLFNPVGDLIAESSFKDDKLNGKFKTYSSGKLVETLNYKNGDLVIKKQKAAREPKVKKVKEKTPKEPKQNKEPKKKDIQKKNSQPGNNSTK